MKIAGIIPARYASVRFPGKPLVDIMGKPMIQHVYEQAKKALKDVYVATDDNRIKEAVDSFKGHVVLTSPDHKSGTDRCAEAIEMMMSREKTDFDVVVNIQGDEPFIQPQQLLDLINCFDDKTTQIATLIKEIDIKQDIFNSNVVKVVVNKSMDALYFSRSPIPFIRSVDSDKWLDNHTFFKHLGIYAYRYGILKHITRLDQSPLEIAESLEQIRWLENGFRIKAIVTELENISIDTPEDLEKINNT